MSDPDNASDINPAIGGMLKSARDFLAHEHSLFRTLELMPVVIGKGKATFSMALPDAYAGVDGMVHGGLYTIIIDSIFGLAVFTALEAIKPIATINLRTDYVGAVAPGSRAICEAECDAIRGDVAYVRGKLTAASNGRLLATGSGAFMVGTKGPIKGMRL